MKTSLPGGWRVYKPPASVQSGLAVLVPKELQTQVGDSVMRQWRMALRIGRIVWVNVHWPVVRKEAKEHLVKEEIRHLTAAVRRIACTDSGEVDGRQVLLTGDLNVTLPEEVEGITGKFVFSNKPKRSVTHAHRLRRQSMIELLGSLGLWAANSFSAVEGTPCVRAATWRIHTAEGPQPHSQMDYACVPRGWKARAEVLDAPTWDWSDHRPLRLSARTA